MTQEAETAPKTAPELKRIDHPQARGGSLYTGGVPGNAGGGRTPKIIKNMALEIAADGGQNVREIVVNGTWQGKPVSASQQLDGWKKAADVGIDKTTIEYKISASVEVKHVIESLGPILASHGMPNDVIASVIRELGQTVTDQAEAEAN